MNFFRLRAISLSLVSLVATAAYAVEQLPEKEEDIPVEYIPRLDYTVSIGLHHLTSSPKVTFGHLGVIPAPPTASADTTDTISKTYSNGSITKDALKTYEMNRDGTPLAAGSTLTTAGWTAKANADGTVTVFTPITTAQLNPDGTLILNADGTYVPVTTPVITTNADGTTTVSDTELLTLAATNKFLAYKDNQTRSWSVTDSKQINTTDKTVSMSTYGVSSAGGSVEADSSGSTGFEVSLERKLGQLGRLEWGISGGLKLVTLNAKASGVVWSNLVKTTDVYHMVNTRLNLPTGVYYTVPTTVASLPDSDSQTLPLLDQSGNPLHDSSGKLVYQYTNSTTQPVPYTLVGDQSVITPLDTNPNDVQWGAAHPETIGMVKIHGNWQLKGAYYLVHLGPTFRYRFNDRFAISGNVGLAIGYIGTVFKANEYYENTVDVYDLTGAPAPSLLIDPTLTNSTVYRSQEQNTTHKFIPGLYGEFNAEYWMTERTGFYLGITQQTMRSFSQDPLSGRTAKVDMGSNSGWRIGIMTRF